MRLSAFLISALSILFSLSASGQQSNEATQQSAGNFADVFGARIHYAEAGSGPSVVLVHGLADDVGVWQSVIPALSARHRVVALDLIGFGRSDKPLLSYRVATFSDFLDGFLTALRIDRASIVGNSLGGWSAADFALAHPDRVDRLVLCDAAGYAAFAKSVNPRTFRALRLASRDDIRHLGPLTFHDKRFYEDLDLAFKQRVTAGDGYTINQVVDSMIRGEDVLDGRVGAIRKPTLILWGREDKLIPLSFAERFHKDIAGSRLEVIDNCGHMPHVECADRFNHVLLKFFGDEQ
jgi:pimeloyl-ACP methyl ester carboxylesterase